MNEKDFINLMGAFKEYLAAEKVFIKDPVRFADVERATEIASELFADFDIAIKDDPLQMGAAILSITGYEFSVCGAREIKLFQEMISKADNFVVYPVEKGNVHIAILFSNALVRIGITPKN